MKNYVNWAIVAPGIIAQSMAKAISESAKTDSRIVPYAVASRDAEKAKAFADKWGFKKVCNSYAELFNDSEVDVVYVANPHAFHFETVMAALEAGKHVLCEKPAGCNLYQLETMMNTAKSKNLFFMEAMWSAFNPCLGKIRQAIQSGKIGKLKHMQSYFCNRTPFEPTSRLWAPELAGGALLDLGIYNIFVAMMIADFSPVVDHSTSVRLVNGIDAWNSATLKFENGATTSFESAVDMPAGSNTHNATIYGEKGFITCENFFMTQEAQIHTYKQAWGNDNDITEVIKAPFDVNGYEYEMRHVTECILNGKLESDIYPHKTSIELCKMMDTLRNDWGMKYPFETGKGL